MSAPTPIPPQAPNPRRLGVLGGSFDPIHLAHLIMAETAREVLHLDQVLFLPAGVQPLKRGQPVTPAEHRVAMVQLAIQDNPAFALSRLEVDRPGPSYTADTLRQLRHDLGGPEAITLWFIIGTDALAQLPRWRDPAAVLSQTRLAVVRRPNSSVDPSHLAPNLPQLQSTLEWIDAPLIDISATDIRRRVAAGLSIRYRVPEAVREYIEANGLYR
ncbi:MAG: nicotinate-nucleotide adenylyltransferase [Chloroflexia bacterium]